MRKVPLQIYSLQPIHNQFLNDFTHRFIVNSSGRRARKTLLNKRKILLLDLIFETDLDKCELIIIELDYLDKLLEITMIDEEIEKINNDIDNIDNKIDLTLAKIKNNINNLK